MRATRPHPAGRAFRRGLAVGLVAIALSACSTAPMPTDSPAAHYADGGAAAITGAYDFGLF